MAIQIPEEDLIYKEDCSMWLLCMDIIKSMRQDKEFMESLKKETALPPSKSKCRQIR